MSPQGAWSPSGSGIGFGNDSGSADSETRSGISGVAGNTAARTGDAQAGLKPIFDADKVQKEVDAQAQITQAFGQQASKTIGDYAGKQAKSLKAHAALETDDSKRQALLDEAARWDEGGAYRIAMHTAMGGLLGGVGGAAGAGATAASAPGLDKLQASVTENLRAAGLPGSAAQVAGSLISSGTAAGIGGVLGGTAGAAAGFDVDANNRQLHLNERKAIQKNSPAFAKKLSAELGRPVSVNEAERWLAEAAYANVDEAARKAQELLLPPNAAAEERQAYNQAKQYLFQIQQAEHNTALFSETNLGLYKNNFAGRDVNDPSYREFVWKNLGVNEKPTNPTATELAIYTERQKQLQLGTVKSLGMMLVTGGMSYVGGKVVNKLSPVSGSANSTPVSVISSSPKDLSSILSSRNAVAENVTSRGTMIQSVPNGTMADALTDFNSLGVANEKIISTPKGEIRMGQLPDGSTIKLRPSNDGGLGRPTIEVIGPNGRTVQEVRYGNKN
ncbi:hypothetical protein B0T40_24940 [Chromobacterium haemolyticum]|nr:hypothetical protein B0T40_24940 [Chromobacterium haemolyticum]